MTENKSKSADLNGMDVYLCKYLSHRLNDAYNNGELPAWFQNETVEFQSTPHLNGCIIHWVLGGNRLDSVYIDRGKSKDWSPDEVVQWANETVNNWMDAYRNPMIDNVDLVSIEEEGAQEPIAPDPRMDKALEEILSKRVGVETKMSMDHKLGTILLTFQAPPKVIPSLSFTVECWLTLGIESLVTRVKDHLRAMGVPGEAEKVDVIDDPFPEDCKVNWMEMDLSKGGGVFSSFGKLKKALEEASKGVSNISPALSALSKSPWINNSQPTSNILLEHGTLQKISQMLSDRLGVKITISLDRGNGQVFLDFEGAPKSIPRLSYSFEAWIEATFPTILSRTKEHLYTMGSLGTADPLNSLENLRYIPIHWVGTEELNGMLTRALGVKTLASVEQYSRSVWVRFQNIDQRVDSHSISEKDWISLTTPMLLHRLKTFQRECILHRQAKKEST